jgi:hypothetical protein
MKQRRSTRKNEGQHQRIIQNDGQNEPKSRGNSDQRAVSDTLAFVITFSIIITSVGLVYGVGFTSLSDIRDAQLGINAQNTFETVAGDINDIRDREASTRTQQIELRGGSLRVDRGSQIGIEVDGDTIYDGPLGSLTYEIDEDKMAYEGGAAFGKYDGSSVVTQKPTFQCNEHSKPALVSITVLKPEVSKGGSSTVEITAKRENTTLMYPNTTTDNDPNEVTVTISNSQYQDAWSDVFDTSGGWTHISGNTYECQANQVYVRVTVVQIELNS